MSDTAIPVGTRVRVVEEGDYRKGKEGVVIQRLSDDTAPKLRYRTLVQFEMDRHLPGSRWYSDSHLVAIDSTDTEEKANP